MAKMKFVVDGIVDNENEQGTQENVLKEKAIIPEGTQNINSVGRKKVYTETRKAISLKISQSTFDGLCKVAEGKTGGNVNLLINNILNEYLEDK